MPMLPLTVVTLTVALPEPKRADQAFAAGGHFSVAIFSGKTILKLPNPYEAMILHDESPGIASFIEPFDVRNV